MGPVIGVACDGTGYGTDGNLWGGEFLVAGVDGFERIGQLKYIPLPGGEAAMDVKGLLQRAERILKGARLYART